MSCPARRSTIATSTPANANSAASIIPVGPPPATTTACSVIATAAAHAACGRRRGALGDGPVRWGSDPLHELQYHAARVRDLEEALAPLLRLDRGGHLDAGAGDSLVLGVDVVDLEDDEQAGGARPGERLRLECGEPRAQEDQVEAGVFAREGDEAVGVHLPYEAEVLL